MPSPRYTDHGPAANACRACNTTHRPTTTTGQLIRCPPAGRWLVFGGPVPGLDQRRKDPT